VQTSEPLAPGESIVWIGADYTEENIGSVSAGDLGTFITTDGERESDGLVVSFASVGAFCCRREQVRRP
jgi:hypothetical protein